MAQTVKNLLHDAINYDESLLAHAIFFAVQKKIVNLDEPADAIKFDDLDHQAITEMRNENLLAMCSVKLFTVPMGNRLFAFYLAENENEARTEHHKIYGVSANQVVDISHKLDEFIYVPDTKKYMTFREIKRNTVDFPYYVCEMQNNKRRN